MDILGSQLSRRSVQPWVVALLFFFCLAPLPAFAQDAADLNWVRMSLELIGGLALFLLGIDRLAEGLRTAAGDQIKAILGRFTSNRVSGALAGASVTALIQSSSVTTVLVVGFVSAGLMTLPQSIGVIFGANIGTTVTAQVAAFDIGKEALPMIALGFLLTSLLRSPAVRHVGSAVLGLGLLFFGMEVMGDAMRPLRTYEPFLQLMQNLEAPIYGIAIGAVFTALVQSSSATTGIVIVMATEGVISLPLGISLALGANIGTCATAGLAALGKSVEATRAAVVHVMFNLAGAFIWVFFIDQLASLAVAVSPMTQGLSGAEQLAADAPRQIANANTIFNVVNTLIFLPAAGLFAIAVKRIVPERAERDILELRYLDDELIETPAIALLNARLETQRMAERIGEMLNLIQPSLKTGRLSFRVVAKLEDEVDWLRDKILGFLHRVAAEDLTLEDGEDFVSSVKAVQSLERAADILESALTPIIINNQSQLRSLSPAVLNKANAIINDSFKEIAAIRSSSPEEPVKPLPAPETPVAQARGARLRSSEQDAVRLYRLEYDLLEALKRSRRHLRRAHAQLDINSENLTLGEEVQPATVTSSIG